MICQKVIYSGRVQGVGFRYQTSQLAKYYTIIGYVKNLHDGTVEVVCAGEAAQVEGFLHQIATHLKRYIKHASITDENIAHLASFTEFKTTY